MGFFLFQWCVLVVGFLVHVGVDRTPARRTRRRVLELAALWVVVCTGVFAVVGGVFHIGPTSDSIADSIGYTRSMFQWEIGWADIGIGVLTVLCARRANRGAWLTAAITMLAVSFYGDGIGHVMQLVEHDNTAPDNLAAIPACFLAPTLAALFTFLYRREPVPGERVPVSTTVVVEPVPATID